MCRRRQLRRLSWWQLRPCLVQIARDADPAEKLAQLKSLLEKELITQADYEEKKAQILARM